MTADASSISAYLASLPADRRAALTRVRAVVNEALPAGYEERLQHGMISWVVPASRLSHTYNGMPLPLASLGSQKQHMALYLMCVYGDDALRAWFEGACRAAGKRLDMGKSCLRFTSVEDVPLEVVGAAIARVPVDAYVASYEATRGSSGKGKPVALAPGEKAGKPAAKAGKPAAKAKPAAKTTKSARAAKRR